MVGNNFGQSLPAEMIIVDVQAPLCRLCGNMNLNLVPIYENENDLRQKIFLYMGLCVDLHDGLPQNICIHCTNSILSWHNFYLSSMKTYNKLQGMLKPTTSGNHLKSENVTDTDNGLREVEEDTEDHHNLIIEESTEQLFEDLGGIEHMKDDELNDIVYEENFEFIEEDKQHETTENQEVKSIKIKLPRTMNSRCIAGDVNSKENTADDPRKHQEIILTITNKKFPSNLLSFENVKVTYECDECDNRFTQKASLFVHKRSHQTTYPFHKRPEWLTENIEEGEGFITITDMKQCFSWPGGISVRYMGRLVRRAFPGIKYKVVNGEPLYTGIKWR